MPRHPGRRSPTNRMTRHSLDRAEVGARPARLSANGEPMVAKSKNSNERNLTLTRNDAPITILLVDDDPDCRMLIRDAIAECKVSNDVHEACNGREALDFLHRLGPHANAPRPGLIFLDIEMPQLDGQQTLKEIKGSPELADI